MKYIIARDKWVYDTYLEQNKINLNEAVHIQSMQQIEQLKVDKNDEMLSIGPHFFDVPYFAQALRKKIEEAKSESNEKGSDAIEA